MHCLNINHCLLFCKSKDQSCRFFTIQTCVNTYLYLVVALKQYLRVSLKSKTRTGIFLIKYFILKAE